MDEEKTMRLRNHLWLITALFLCVSLVPSALAGSDPECDPTAEIESALASFSMATAERARAAGKWDRFEDALTATIERHPSSVYLQRHYQDLHRDDLEALVPRYAERAAANPEDPASLYLYGRILGILERKEAEEPFLAALQADSQYPWAHLGLARFYEVTQPDQDKARSHIVAFIEQCPTSPVALSRLQNIADPDLAEDIAARVRSAFAESKDAASVPHLQAVWAAEFKSVSPVDHAAVRERIRHDLQLLNDPELKKDPRVLQAMLEGYALVGDEDALTRTVEVMAKRFPQDPTAKKAAMQQFHERHIAPARGDVSPESQTYYREYAAATEGWCKMWPDDPETRLAHFDALSEVDTASVEELLAVGDGLLELAARRPDFRVEPIVPFQVARVYVDQDVAINRVPDIVNKALQHLEATKPQVMGEGPEIARMNSEIERMVAYQGWSGREVLFDVYLKQDRLEEARAVLGEMERGLPQDPPVGGPEWEQHQFVHLRASLLERRATLAGTESRTVDALLYHQAALMLDPMSEAINRDAMVEQWRALGAGEDAVQAWLTFDGGLPEPLGVPKALELPQFEFQDLTGHTWRLSELRGKVLLINVWASWCPPCLVELPWLQKLHERFKDDPNMVVLTLNVDEKPGLVDPIMRRNGFDFPVVFAFDYMLDLWGHQWAIPCTWIVDTQGTVRRELSGFEDVDDGWLDRITRAMIEVRTEGVGPRPMK
jgi:thiol-disulfide isomerase/thioredoxin